MSHATPIRARIVLAIAALTLVACGAEAGPTEPAGGVPAVGTPRFDGGEEPPPPAPPDSGTGTQGNYQSPHV